MAVITKKKKYGKHKNRTNYDRTPSVWKEKFWLDIVELARSGLTNRSISKTLGVSNESLRIWLRDKPDLDVMVRRIREDKRTNESSFQNYVYKRLPKNLKKLWDEINSWEKSENTAEKMEAIFKENGKFVRQQLYIHALICGNFNPSKACQKTNTCKKTVDSWIENDPEFGELLQEIQWHKGNFFEEALVKLVNKGDASAIIFTNKTFNKDRGYSEKINVDVSGEISHTTDVQDLELPLEVRKVLLEAIRAKKGLDKSSKVIPIEATAVRDVPEPVTQS